MTPEERQETARIFETARGMAAEERAAYLEQACGGDGRLRAEVGWLLRADEEAGDFLEDEALNEAARLMAGEGERGMTGKQLGPYVVLGRIGGGGMGEVYRAHDSRLKRDVAIKILPGLYAADAGRLGRFEQEARAIAALNHPNVLAIYDTGEHEGTPYIVTELLEGKDLRSQLRGRGLPRRKVLDYGRQIARGLAAAHEHGIVHRDLKPENLFVTKDGRVKILDFGLAKYRPPGMLGGQGPRGTDAGTVLGTVAYMAPEQVRGEEAGARADLFAFGVVLYEMLSGRQPFEGASAVETMNAILKEEPGPLEVGVGAPLRKVVGRCLEKREQDRFQSAEDLGFQLELLSEEAELQPNDVKPRRLGLRQFAGLGTAVLLMLVVGLRAWWRWPTDEAVVTRFQIPLPDKATFVPLAELSALSVAPNGCCLAFVATQAGQRNLWVRRLDGVASQRLAGTEEAMSPFWSPDSRFIAFFAQGRLKRVAATGGTPEAICELPINAWSGTWGRAGVILIGGNEPASNGIYRVDASGGPVTRLLRSEQATGYWPSFLPDGRHFLFYSQGRDLAKGIYAGSIESTESELILKGNSRGEYAEPGYLLYVREGTLVAHPFDASRRKFSGTPVTVAEQVASFDPTGWAEFSAGRGTLAYHPDSPTTLRWFDREGREGEEVLPPGFYETHRISPNGERVAFTSQDPHNGRHDLWISELGPNKISRITNGANDTGDPVWSPDGRRLASFFYPGHNRFSLAIRRLGEEGPLEHPVPGWMVPTDWSLDGKYLALTQEQDPNDPLSGRNVWIAPMFGDRKVSPFLRTRFDESHARFSPDRRWVAYVSDESGRMEVYVRRFDGTGEKTRISGAGGSRPCWRRDGQELFYLSGGNEVMAVPIVGGATLKAGNAKALFRVAAPGWNGYGNAFDVAPDGERFLVQTGVGGASLMPFVMVRNWEAAGRLKEDGGGLGR